DRVGPDLGRVDVAAVIGQLDGGVAVCRADGAEAGPGIRVVVLVHVAVGAALVRAAVVVVGVRCIGVVVRDIGLQRVRVGDVQPVQRVVGGRVLDRAVRVGPDFLAEQADAAPGEPGAGGREADARVRAGHQ